MTITASAPGKVILCGEHAVVYGQPAIALPLADVRATAEVTELPPDTGLLIDAPDIGECWTLRANALHPLALLAQLTLAELQLRAEPDVRLTLRSAIPIASGMGSGAALGAALVKVLFQYAGAALSPAVVSRLVYQSERRFHGTPSGIDNTVVSFEQAIWFVRGRSSQEQPTPPFVEPLVVGRPFSLVIADTGVRAPTHVTVGWVREQWQHAPERFNQLFAAIGALSDEVRALLAAGDLRQLGAALDRNHTLLQQLDVSSPALETLVGAARAAGAFGAKLSGGGGGGIMLAVVDTELRPVVARALQDAGAQRIVETTVG